MDHINYAEIAGGEKTKIQRLEFMDQEIERVGYICLTDALLNRGYGGDMVMEWLDDDEKKNAPTQTNQRYKLFVLRDEWGNIPQPGDVIIRSITKPLRDRAGRKLRTTMINDLKRRGDFERLYVERREYVVDEKGCIDCSYTDAGWFLDEYGVHWQTGAALCGRRELSSEPCKAPDGNMRHVWYWRYKEIPPSLYATLPSLETAPPASKTKSKIKTATPEAENPTPTPEAENPTPAPRRRGRPKKTATINDTSD